MAAYCPDEEEFIWLDFDPQKGSEQAGRRPAVVLSPRKYNQRSKLCIVCPVTNQAKGYPLEVPIPPGGAVTGVVLSDHVKSMSWEDRNAELIGPAPSGVVAGTRRLLKAITKIT
jgi:mRNA interferase MazF